MALLQSTRLLTPVLVTSLTQSYLIPRFMVSRRCSGRDSASLIVSHVTLHWWRRLIGRSEKYVERVQRTRVMWQWSDCGQKNKQRTVEQEWSRDRPWNATARGVARRIGVYSKMSFSDFRFEISGMNVTSTLTIKNERGHGDVMLQIENATETFPMSSLEAVESNTEAPTPTMLIANMTLSEISMTELGGQRNYTVSNAGTDLWRHKSLHRFRLNSTSHSGSHLTTIMKNALNQDVFHRKLW